MDTLPNFLIIGAQKAGTSWFQDMLRQHPEIFIYSSEIHFFDKSANYSKGIEWYQSHFDSAERHKSIGEKTPDYLWANGIGAEGHLPQVHKNIYDHLPDAKLIVLLRNPVHRAISALNHLLTTGRISPLISIDRLLTGDKDHLVEAHGVIQKGMYVQQIMAFLEFFERRQLLVLVYEEDVVECPTSGLKKACDFLGVYSDFMFTGLQKRINAHKQSMVRLYLDYYFPTVRTRTRFLDSYFKPLKMRPSDRTIKSLYDIYSRQNKFLFEFLNRHIPSWKMPSAIEQIH